MTRRTGGLVAGVVVTLLALPSASSADGKPDDKQACLTASEQGQNQRDDGLYRAARASFVACARDACPKLVAQSCTRWLRELDQDAPTVVLGAKDDQGNDLTDVTVLLDGQPFATVLDGKPLESDAGEHVLHFERSGSVPAEQKLVLRAGEKARGVTVTLRPVGSQTSISEPEPARSVGPPEGEPAPEPLLSTHHVTAGALVLGAIGAASAGALLMVASNQNKSSAASLRTNLSSDACTNVATATCQSLSDKVAAQHQDMNLAAGLFTGAGLLAAGGVVAWLVWPHSDPAQSQASGSIVPVSRGAVFQVVGVF